MISNTDYEKLLIENRKSFREALRRQRKANAILHAEIDRLKALIPVQEHKPESEDNEAFLLHLVDVVWGTAHEDESVPSTDWAKRMVIKAKETFKG